jgi:glycosyltransferase involved in cell wall biosynthesis
MAKLGIDIKDDFVKSKVKAFLTDQGVCVIMGEFLSWCLPWLEVAQSLGIPFFGHAHGFDVSAHLRESKWRKEYTRFNESAGVITVSEISKARLVDLGLNESKVHVIPCGVDVPPRNGNRPQRPTVHCLAVGRMVSKKGPILLLDGFRRAAEVCPFLQLDYVGDGELFTAAQQFVRAFDMADRVTLHGSQPSEAVLSLMKNADIFLQHSMVDPVSGDEEGLPVGILEAMANNLPVVSTRHAGIPEAVIEGKTGYLVEEGNSRDMAERLVTLARQPDLRQRMGAAGWQRAKERFSWEKERDQLRHILGLTNKDGGCLTAPFSRTLGNELPHTS